MITFTGSAEAAVELNTFYWLNKTSLPEAVSTMIEPLLGQTKSPVDAAARTAEIVYANRAALPPEWQDMAAALAVLCELHGFHGMNFDSRGSLMALVMRGQTVEAEPEVRAEYVVPEPEPVP